MPDSVHTRTPGLIVSDRAWRRWMAAAVADALVSRGRPRPVSGNTGGPKALTLKIGSLSGHKAEVREFEGFGALPNDLDGRR